MTNEAVTGSEDPLPPGRLYWRIPRIVKNTRYWLCSAAPCAVLLVSLNGPHHRR